MRTCKVCKKEKEFNYFRLDERCRSVHKDEDGKIWHGKVCFECFQEYQKSVSGKTHLKKINCVTCGKAVLQKTVRQKACSLKCYKLSRKVLEDVSDLDI